MASKSTSRLSRFSFDFLSIESVIFKLSNEKLR
jgi:hypothetical protein